MSDAIHISVVTRYLDEQSQPSAREYAFAYTITIRNDGTDIVQLLSRHWIITDANDDVQEVRGDGVVGAQPHIAPGESYIYSSGCLLHTAHGTMHGSYRMVSRSGEYFDAPIAPFLLAHPNALN